MSLTPSPNPTDRSALICGVNGQDGAYLAQLLLGKGYRVWGTSRDALGSSFGNLARLGIRERVRTLSLLPEDFRSLGRVGIAHHPFTPFARLRERGWG